MNDADIYLPSVQAAARYGVCLKTLDRWTENDKLNFPQPLWINRRRFWRLADLHAWERAHGLDDAPHFRWKGPHQIYGCGGRSRTVRIVRTRQQSALLRGTQQGGRWLMLRTINDAMKQ